MRFVVLGAGMMGRAIVYDLSRSAVAKDILVADFDRKRAKEVASQFGMGEACATFADVRDVMNLAKVLRGADAAINCAQYNWNVEVMRAALQARVHYLDLGGLYHVTRRQFSLDGAFRRARLLALIGSRCGSVASGGDGPGEGSPCGESHRSLGQVFGAAFAFGGGAGYGMPCGDCRTDPCAR
jgi:saccharopine dehydrogenase-like NADP-dependent oxidoreductase